MSTLFPFQQLGIEWLSKNHRAGLFDEQGLGKTVQALLAADRAGIKRLLVVAPTAVADNWRKEAQRWAPHRRPQAILSGRTTIDPRATLVIVTHGLTFDSLINVQLWGFDGVVVDESHVFVKPTAQRTAALLLGEHALVRRSRISWLLTGTPMPNNPMELWTPLAGMAPDRLRDKSTGKLLNYDEWRERFCVTKPSGYGDGYSVIGVKNVPELKERLKGFSLRRLKKDVLPDLPPIRYSTVALTVDTPTMWLVDQLEPEKQLMKLGLPDDEIVEALQQEPSFNEWWHACGLAKVPGTIDLLENDLRGGMKKVIVVAYHLDVIAQLTAGLAKFGAVSLTGSNGAMERSAIVDAFQNDPETRVIVLQIQAGGVGLTLTAAADVVFVEQLPSPGKNAQAADRAHRIGQTERVLVRCLYLPDSIDEPMTEILTRKAAMIAEVLS